MMGRLSPEEIEDLSRKDVLSYGIFHVDLLENRKWEIEKRRWMTEIYTVVNPWQILHYPAGQARTLSIQKSTQCGMSTMGIVRLFHLADNFDVRIMYMLPRQQDYIDFVTTRVDPMISSSERLSGLLGSPDSTRAKQIGNSYIFFMESTVEPRMMPADVLMIDEIDLSVQTHVSTAANRLDNSPWKLKYYFSTPTVANYGINARYQTSDMRKWYVKCPKCNTWQTLSWDGNLRVEGNRLRPKNVFFGCTKCDKPLTPEIIQTGQWVADYPERSSEHIGFHISQLMTHSANELYKISIQPDTELVEFYRKRLGMPYETGYGSVSRDDMLSSCFLNEPHTLESMYDGQSTYYLGADQGNELQVIIAKTNSRLPAPQIVHMELIPYTAGGFDRLGQLMYIYKIKRAVVDGDPNRHSVRKLQEKFLGRLLVADYAETRFAWNTKKNPNVAGGKVETDVTIGRSQAFDRLMASIKESKWSLPGSMPELPKETELIIDHITALKRDIRKRKTAAGEVDVPVWVEIRPSHLAHAWVYLKTAMEIDRGKDVRVAVINSGTTANPNIVSIGSNEIDMVDYTNRLIKSHLSEVPLEQLKNFINDITKNNKYDKADYPMPLRHKLKFVEVEGVDLMQIEHAVRELIFDKELLT